MTTEELIRQEALRQGVAPALALAVAQTESGFNQGARGTSGEVGVFQLMPPTAAGLRVDPYDLLSNIRGGITYLRQMLGVCGGREDLALMAYNSGPDACTHNNIPPSARTYASTVLSRKPLYGPVQTAGIEVGAGMGDWVPVALILGGIVLLAVALD